MFVKLHCLDGSSAMVNVEDVSYFKEIRQDDTFYHQTTKHCVIVFKSGEQLAVAHTLVEVETTLEAMF